MSMPWNSRNRSETTSSALQSWHLCVPLSWPPFCKFKPFYLFKSERIFAHTVAAWSVNELNGGITH